MIYPCLGRGDISGREWGDDKVKEPLRLFRDTFHATFVRRPNRFLVECAYKGRTLNAFLPNPGRLQELLLPGVKLYVVEDGGKNLRKTSFTVVAVERDGVPIMLHTHRTNQVTRYLIEAGLIESLNGAKIVKPEVTVGRSRFDFLLEDEDGERYLEVKSCTLVGKRVAMFPDAITERGAKHLEELAVLARDGKRAIVLFVVHWPFAEVFMPDYHTDLHFAQTLLKVRNDVEVIPVAVRWHHDLSLGPETKILPIPWGYIAREAQDRGTYLLLLKLTTDRNIDVGSLGSVVFKKGFYVYVGSAMVNLTARIERHRRMRKQHHWHIDVLRDEAEFEGCLVIRSSTRLECDVAKAVSGIAAWSIPHFGSSDCSCETHLFGFTDNPISSALFQKVLQYFRMDRFGV